MHQHAPSFSMHDRKGIGVRHNSFQRRLNRRQKLLPQTRLLALVPEKCIIDFGGSRGADEDCHQWERVRIR